MSRLLPHPVLSGALFAAWLALIGKISVAHLLLAAILAWGLPLAAAAFLTHLPRVASPGIAVLGPMPRLRPVFVTVPLALTHPQSIALLASIITMTPGTVSAVLSADRRSLLVHALDSGDPDALVAQIKQRYERPLQEIFGC
jgi:multicomponent K+:H+ antiporter subunit E